VVDVTRSALVPLLGPEFDDFLFAPVGEDGNGLLLSVLSALTRVDVDPWQEAASLARLPGETATRRLAALIAALPDRPSAHLDPGTISARLITLLPRAAGSNIPSREALPGGGEVPASRAVVIYVIVIAFVLVAQSITASRLSPPQVVDDRAETSGTVLSPMLPPSSGQ
jgi:hypothetical protein